MKVNLPYHEEYLTSLRDVPQDVINKILLEFLNDQGYRIKKWQVGHGTGPHYDLVKHGDEPYSEK